MRLHANQAGEGPKFDFVNIGGQAGYLNLNIWQG